MNEFIKDCYTILRSLKDSNLSNHLQKYHNKMWSNSFQKKWWANKWINRVTSMFCLGRSIYFNGTFFCSNWMASSNISSKQSPNSSRPRSSDLRGSSRQVVNSSTEFARRLNLFSSGPLLSANLRGSKFTWKSNKERKSLNCYLKAKYLSTCAIMFSQMRTDNAN